MSAKDKGLSQTFKDSEIMKVKSGFSGYQIASLVRLVSPLFNVRVNKAGNLAIEPSVVTNPDQTRKYIFYKVADGFVIRTGQTYDYGQHYYSRLGSRTANGEVNYTFPTFADALAHFKGTLKRNGLLG